MKEALVVVLVIVGCILLYDYHTSTPVLTGWSDPYYGNTSDSVDSACYNRCINLNPDRADAVSMCTERCGPNRDLNWFKTR